MTDYIKRIQSNLSRKNIKLSKSVIREELEQLGYNNETLTDDLAVSILNKLVIKFSNEVEPMPLIQEIEPPQDSELITNVQEIELSPNSELITNIQEIELSQEQELSHQDANTNLVTNTRTEASTEASTEVPTDLNLIERVEVENQVIESEEETETKIVVSEDDKHDLIATQSSVLDVQLSELETVELCSKIPDVFDDYKSFVDSVTSAIKAFVDDKFDHQETKTVDDSISELRQHIANRQARLDTKFAQGLNDVKEDLEQIRSNIKSRQSAILERFRIPAKT
ncbi:hypothetical protein CAL7716_107140 (plasmid) [Calothrix sp. PCC 7716]|nr:hypothetical protein CAL7716_107140 [Calothrix sp. PCC 7716]